MASFHRFEDIVAWQLAYALKQQIQEICKRDTFRNDLKLHDQLLDAARSGPRNIAEGFARWRHKDFARFTRIAKASEVEILNHLLEARDSGHISEAERPERMDSHAAAYAQRGRAIVRVDILTRGDVGRYVLDSTFSPAKTRMRVALAREGGW